MLVVELIVISEHSFAISVRWSFVNLQPFIRSFIHGALLKFKNSYYVHWHGIAYAATMLTASIFFLFFYNTQVYSCSAITMDIFFLYSLYLPMMYVLEVFTLKFCMYVALEIALILFSLSMLFFSLQLMQLTLYSWFICSNFKPCCWTSIRVVMPGVTFSTCYRTRTKCNREMYTTVHCISVVNFLSWRRLHTYLFKFSPRRALLRFSSSSLSLYLSQFVV